MMHVRAFAAPALVGLVLILVPHASSAIDPAAKCESGKLKIAGKYGDCRLKAESKGVKKGEAPDFTKCTDKFSDKWQKVEEKAQLAELLNACPSEGDESAMGTLITNHANEVAALLAGGTGYVDCGDGTVVDSQTGLMWQKTDDAGGLTDKDNTYTWTAGFEKPDGTAFTSFLATLNEWGISSCSSGGPTGGCCRNAACEDPSCYAGYCDWRLPTVVELQTILLAPYPCGTTPCIDESVFGPTAPFFYWSASTGGPGLAWGVFFDEGLVFEGYQDEPGRVRAVRSGSCP